LTERIDNGHERVEELGPSRSNGRRAHIEPTSDVLGFEHAVKVVQLASVVCGRADEGLERELHGAFGVGARAEREDSFREVREPWCVIGPNVDGNGL